MFTVTYFIRKIICIGLFFINISTNFYMYILQFHDTVQQTNLLFSIFISLELIHFYKIKYRKELFLSLFLRKLQITYILKEVTLKVR